MMDVLTRVIVIVFSAAVGEGIIEFLFSPLVELWLPEDKADDPQGKAQIKRTRTVLFNIASALLGVVIGIGFRLELFGALGATESIVGMDRVLTGVLIGRGSNWVHGLANRFFTGIRPDLDAIT
jgi:hypothetical protein